MRKMYPAIVNSPKTELTAAITQAQTDISVTDTSVLLPGEGIAVIGNGETAETITYTSVEGNTLKGCLRGYQGIAQAWTPGTRVARNFAAADWDAARENIMELADRLDTPERSAITLQPGIRIVQANQNAAFRLAGLQGRTVLNYQSQIGIIGVLNPYVIRYGENLIPPFYEWTKTGHTSNDTDAYGLLGTLVSAAIGSDAFASCNIDVIGDQDYTLSNPVSSTGFMRISTYNSAGTRIQGIFVKPGESKTIKIATTAVRLSVVLSGVTAYTDEFDSTKWTWQAGTSRIFKNPMLVIGNIAKPFKPREDAMLAFQTELHANPDTGANPDIVFDRDGQYFKLAKWKKLILNEELSYANYSTGSTNGFKRVRVLSYPAYDPSTWSPVGTKYNGIQLSRGNIEIADALYGSTDGSLLAINISNSDSGWGDSYTPTTDEIKAYFMGWKMYDVTVSSSGQGVYNGSAGANKRWAYRSDGVSATYAGGTSTLPTAKASNWMHYQLLYQLAMPTVEPITSEGQLTFIEGDNQVEVGTGIVLRELAKPQASPNYYNVNASSLPMGRLSKAVSRYLGVYKAGRKEPWEFVVESYNGVGFVRSPISQYDSSAAYSVTYLMLDKYPAAEMMGTYAENEKALQLDTVRTLQENTTRISVLENKKAEKDNPAWITPTLLNGWTKYNDFVQNVQYYKDSLGNVQLKGLIKPGVYAVPVFQLPQGYRPKLQYNFGTVGSHSSTQVAAQVNVNPSGTLMIMSTANEWVSLDGISFQAEQ
ncbi:hypothetical protein [Paenibacillus amylolyticus]|uniref:Uncharacterized protein n=1 Tax=Paenibacillus amylolyticus TaxID=1451 RepID=A0A124DXX0_PAEAM|nr:hypothetical protein [Paenibacillus amylolyticus]GAS82385.1 unknown protein [Paenibacillus amylolyticus]